MKKTSEIRPHLFAQVHVRLHTQNPSVFVCIHCAGSVSLANTVFHTLLLMFLLMACGHAHTHGSGIAAMPTYLLCCAVVRPDPSRLHRGRSDTIT